uniref:Uncharacterized protein n=1 Tax=Acrobeloides nanus TaxID=290746 RepID=A0A914CGI9_9BILA
MDAIFWVILLLSLNILYLWINGTDIFFKRSFWGFLIVMFALTFISGQKWNQINGPPFAIRSSQSKEMHYIYPSNRVQLVAESLIVMSFYGAVALGVIFMNEAFEWKVDLKEKEGQQLSLKENKAIRSKISRYRIYKYIMIYAGLGIIVVFFSYLISIFRMKVHGYPLRFLFA